MPTENADLKIGTYLGRLRAKLGGMSDEEASEIVAELRSHILDKVGLREGVTPSRIDAALIALGPPEELARQYLLDALLTKTEGSRSPLRLFENLFRWATLSIAGSLVFLTSSAGYFFGVVFILCAIMKPFHPHTAGLWVFPDGSNDTTISLRLGFGGAPLGGRELLGWWIVPAGLAAGCALVMITTHFAFWCVRRYQSTRHLPRETMNGRGAHEWLVDQ